MEGPRRDVVLTMEGSWRDVVLTVEGSWRDVVLTVESSGRDVILTVEGSRWEFVVLLVLVRVHWCFWFRLHDGLFVGLVSHRIDLQLTLIFWW